MACEEALEFLFIKWLLAIFGFANTKDELGAITISFFVFGELGTRVKGDGLLIKGWNFGTRGFDVFFSFDHLAMRGFGHTFEDSP